jgi:adenylate cyclase
MGLHHGEAVARGDDFIGRTVNIASRVSDLAGPGELLVSEAFVGAVGELTSATFEPIGPARIKGVQEPVWLHRLAAR